MANGKEKAKEALRKKLRGMIASGASRESINKAKKNGLSSIEKKYGKVKKSKTARTLDKMKADEKRRRDNPTLKDRIKAAAGNSIYKSSSVKLKDRYKAFKNPSKRAGDWAADRDIGNKIKYN